MTHAELLAEGRWYALCSEQGWSEHSQVALLEGFVRDRGLLAEFAEYARDAAAQENTGAHGSDDESEQEEKGNEDDEASGGDSGS